MTEQNVEDYKNFDICRFCGKKNLISKIRNHCLSNSSFIGLAHQKSSTLQRIKVILSHFYLTILAVTIVILFRKI